MLWISHWGGEYKVLVLDQRMPKLLGMEIAAKVEETGVDCLCIILTSHADADVAFQTVSHEIVFQYMLKPVDGGSLRDAIDSALEVLAKR